MVESHAPSAPMMKACKVTVTPLSDSHSLRGVYFLSFSALAASKEFTSPFSRGSG